MASALIGEGKEGVAWLQGYDMWSPARQYMIYHGQPRILTEIASGQLADPYVNPQKGRPLGPQEPHWNFPVPYSKDTWTLGQQVDYGITAALAGMAHVAKYGNEWLYNFYRVHRDWTTYNKGPFAFIVPATQRDPFATYEMLDILKFGDVEIHKATAAFSANGKQYPAGSWVIKTAQPYGAFAKTMLEKQVYPDLRIFPGGPPEPPYDVTGHTLWMLMGVTVDVADKPFEAPLELLKTVAPVAAAAAARPKGAYLVDPGTYGFFKTVAELQKANVPVYRAGKALRSAGREVRGRHVRDSADAGRAEDPREPAKKIGITVAGVDRVPAVDGFRLKPATKVGLWKGAGNMPGGWLMWMLEQYGINHEIVKSQDFTGDLNAKYNVILLPSNTSKARIVSGLDPKRNDPAEWSWAFGVGEDGWKKLRAFVENGGTLLAIGSSVETAHELLDLPIEKALPEGRRASARGRPPPAAGSADAVLRDAFSSPARLMQTLRDRVADPQSLFYCPGSLLANEFDVNNPVAWGMPASWPVFFEGDQAYRLRPDSAWRRRSCRAIRSERPAKRLAARRGVPARPGEHPLVRIGKGYVVTYGGQIDFRTQPRATFKLIFNGMFHGPSTPVPAAQMGKLGRRERTTTSNESRVRLRSASAREKAHASAPRRPR